ncbi:MAG TPA: MerR family transcriptional regulator [Candidatus Omnitrophota bacterium]|nr:MerR family transcriptional regulator [Candidatus Omnitrophota bacterium]
MFMIFDKKKPLFTISVAAEMLECHPRTLRIYEEEGLVHPYRRNNIRYYSQDDIESIKRICELMDELSINLSGVRALFKAASKFHIRIERMIDEMLE